MARKALFLHFLVFISLPVLSMGPLPRVAHKQEAENYKICSQCRTHSSWSALIKGSCEHYFCNKCSIQNAQEYNGNCRFCLKSLFGFSYVPESLKYEVAKPEKLKRPQGSIFGAMLQDAFKVMMGPDDPVANGAPNVSEMFHAYSLLHRAELGDYYEEEPFDCSACLDEDIWLNQFWKQLENAPQSEKDNAVAELNKTFINCERDYPHWRVRIAAAAKIKANVGVYVENYNRGGISEHDSPLLRALDADDESLINILLECNVPIVPQDILFYARSKKVADELVRRGADIKAKTWSNHTMLEIVMQRKKYNADLVGFYIKNGLSAYTFRDGLTPLHRLIAWHKRSVQAVQKIEALLDGMLPQAQLELLNVKNTERLHFADNVFGMLEKGDRIKNVLLYCYLAKKRDEAKAFIEKEGCKIVQIP